MLSKADTTSATHLCCWSVP